MRCSSWGRSRPSWPWPRVEPLQRHNVDPDLGRYDRLPALQKVANDWAATKGVSVEVVQKEQGDIRFSQVRTVASTSPPTS